MPDIAIGYEPIKVAYTLNGLGFPPMTREPEAATQTFQIGVPLVLSSGNLQEAAFGAAELIYGFSMEPGSNLTVAGTAQGLSELTPPNQPNAITEPIGARIRDGKIGVVQATGDVVFTIVLQLGDVFTQALVVPGTLYGIAKDGTSGFWYLDKDDTAGDNAVLEILGHDSSGPNSATLGSRVFVRVGATKRVFA